MGGSRGSARTWRRSRDHSVQRHSGGRQGLQLSTQGGSVGHCHPLCAVGMSVGFTDAVTLVRSKSVEEYAAARRAGGRVPELLSMGLYDLFVGAEGLLREIDDALAAAP